MMINFRGEEYDTSIYVDQARPTIGDELSVGIKKYVVNKVEWRSKPRPAMSGLLVYIKEVSSNEETITEKEIETVMNALSGSPTVTSSNLADKVERILRNYKVE